MSNNNRQLTTKTRYTLGLRSDLAVVGYDHENADMDRPNGEVIRERFYLTATNERGDRRAWGWFAELAEAEAAFETAPSVETWAETEPEYGSRAWQAYGEADQLDREARLLEDERWGFDTRYTRY